MSWDYVHLITHPFPIVLVVTGTVAGILGWLLGREGLEKYGLVSLVIAGAFAIPSYLTGLAAADVVGERTFVRPSIVQTHRSWATWAAFALLTCGVLALFSLLQSHDRRLRRFALLVGLPTALLVGVAAFAGGRIEHGPGEGTTPALHSPSLDPEAG